MHARNISGLLPRCRPSKFSQVLEESSQGTRLEVYPLQTLSLRGFSNPETEAESQHRRGLL